MTEVDTSGDEAMSKSKSNYTIQVALAGKEVAKAARDHVRGMRGLIEAGRLDLTGDGDACEMVAAGITRLERALAVLEATVQGRAG